MRIGLAVLGVFGATMLAFAAAILVVAASRVAETGTPQALAGIAGALLLVLSVILVAVLAERTRRLDGRTDWQADDRLFALRQYAYFTLAVMILGVLLLLLPALPLGGTEPSPSPEAGLLGQFGSRG